MQSELSNEVGLVGRLFKCNIDLFWALLQRIATLKIEPSLKEALREEFSRLYFWGERYYPYEGRLDTILAKSSRLRYHVLHILTEIGNRLCDDKTGIFALVNGRFGDAKLSQQCVDLRNLLDIVHETLQDAVSSDSDVSTTFSTADDKLKEAIGDLRSRNQCLIDIGASLERPAPDAELTETEAPVIALFQASTPAEIWTRKILDTYPDIDLTLAERLGEANWQRYQRLSQKSATMGESDNENDVGEDDQLGAMPIFSENTLSSKDGNSIFSTSGVESSGYGATTATYVSQLDFDYSFPVARKRMIAKNARSQATYTSIMTGNEERGWLQLPPLPFKEDDLGKPFRCTVCGDRLQEVFTRTDWKRHVLMDLEPYICTFSTCELGITSFPSRKLWADHEFTGHRFIKTWTCNECPGVFDDKDVFRRHLQNNHRYSKLTEVQLSTMIIAAATLKSDNADAAVCPFCSESPGITNRAFVIHVARHMEEIALAVLPRDSNSDVDDVSVSFNQSLPRILDDPDTERPTKPVGVSEPDGETRWSLDSFVFLAVLGKGVDGKAFLVENKISKELYAIKVYKKEHIIENDEVASIQVEKRVCILANKERHPFLVHLAGTIQTETRICYITEYIGGGDLMFHVQKGQLGTKRTLFYAAELCLALNYLHENGIIHRNVTLESVLLTLDGHIKLTNFRFCKEEMWYGSTTSTFCGTSEFMAPEILLDKKYSRTVDWWAFGVLVYQMLLQQSPFRGEDVDEIYDAILTDQPLYPIHMPRTTVSFLSMLMLRDPDQRLGSGPTDAHEVMSHAYFKDVNWDDVYNKRISPPFVPTVASSTDTSNFDPEFTSITPALTPVQSVPSEAMQAESQGFSSWFDLTL